MILSVVMTRNVTGSSTSHNRVMTESGTRSHVRKWYRKSWPEVAPEVMTRSGTGSHVRKWYQKSWPEVAPEVMTGSGTGSHDWKWHQKSWPEVVPEVMTGSGTGSHDRKCHRKSWPEVTDRQTDTECFKIGNNPCCADISSNISSAGLSSRNCFDTGRTRNPEPRTQNPEPRSQDEERNKESALS